MNDMSDEVQGASAKPRNKLFIFGGLGCLLIVLLCVGGMGVAFYFGQDLAEEMANITSSIETSAAVEEEIGGPVTVTPDIMPQITQVDGKAYTTYTGKVSGPDGDGTYQAQLSNNGADYELESLIVDVNGKQIDISDEEELDLGIDLGEE